MSKATPKFVNPQNFNTIVPKPKGGGNIVVSPWSERDSGKEGGTYVVEGEYFEQFAACGQLAPFPGGQDKEVTVKHEGNTPVEPAVDTGGDAEAETEPVTDTAAVEAEAAPEETEAPAEEPAAPKKKTRRKKKSS